MKHFHCGEGKYREHFNILLCAFTGSASARRHLIKELQIEEQDKYEQILECSACLCDALIKTYYMELTDAVLLLLLKR